jgi:hypothetical protein
VAVKKESGKGKPKVASKKATRGDYSYLSQDTSKVTDAQRKAAKSRTQKQINADNERALMAVTFVPGGALIGGALKGAKAASTAKKVYETNRAARLAKGTVTKTTKATQGKKASITAKTSSGAKYSPTKGTTVKIEKQSRPQNPFSSQRRKDTLIEKTRTEGRKSGAKAGAVAGGALSETFQKGKRVEKKNSTKSKGK